MFKSGWARLWAVLSGALIVVALVYSAYYVWGVDACYSFMTISTADNIKPTDKEVVEGMRQEIATKIFCGKTQYSIPITLEQLARRKVVTQIGFQWLEPSGWVFEKRETLDVLDGDDIKALTIIDNVSSYVHKARLLVVALWVIAAISASIALLLIGLGVAWVRKGFKQ